MLTLAKPNSATAKRVLRVQALAGLSQVTAAAQLVALLLAVGRGRPSDTYVILFAASQITVSVLVIGGLQPLTISRPQYSGWRRWIIAGTVSNAVLLIGTAAFLLATNYPADIVGPTAALLVLSGAWAVTATVWGVHEAALGSPGRLAAVTTLPNVCATIAVIASPVARVPVMCVGLLVGNIWTCGLLRSIRRRRGPDVWDGPTPQPLARRDVAGLLGSSSIGALGPFALQAVTATYPPGQATILGFASRVASGIVSVGVTAYTNATTDWTRQDPRPLRLATQISLGGLMAAAAALGLLVLLSGGPVATAGAAAAAFVFAAAAQGCSSRALAMRDKLYVYRRAAVVSVFLYAAGVVGLSAGPHTATLFFAVIASIAAVTGLIFCVGLRWKREVLALGVLLIAAVASGAVGLAR